MYDLIHSNESALYPERLCPLLTLSSPTLAAVEALDRWPRSMSLLTMTSRPVYYVSELLPRTIVAKRKFSHNPPDIPTQEVESEERAHHQKTPQSMGHAAQSTSPLQYTYGYPVHMPKAAGAPNEPTHANGITQMPPRMRRQTRTSIRRAPPDWE